MKAHIACFSSRLKFTLHTAVLPSALLGHILILAVKYTDLYGLFLMKAFPPWSASVIFLVHVSPSKDVSNLYFPLFIPAQDAAKVCRGFIEREQGEVRFSAVALSHS